MSRRKDVIQDKPPRMIITNTPNRTWMQEFERLQLKKKLREDFLMDRQMRAQRREQQAAREAVEREKKERAEAAAEVERQKQQELILAKEAAEREAKEARLAEQEAKQAQQAAHAEAVRAETERKKQAALLAASQKKTSVLEAAVRRSDATALAELRRQMQQEEEGAEEEENDTEEDTSPSALAAELTALRARNAQLRIGTLTSEQRTERRQNKERAAEIKAFLEKQQQQSRRVTFASSSSSVPTPSKKKASKKKTVKNPPKGMVKKTNIIPQPFLRGLVKQIVSRLGDGKEKSQIRFDAEFVPEVNRRFYEWFESIMHNVHLTQLGNAKRQACNKTISLNAVIQAVKLVTSVKMDADSARRKAVLLNDDELALFLSAARVRDLMHKMEGGDRRVAQDAVLFMRDVFAIHVYEVMFSLTKALHAKGRLVFKSCPPVIGSRAAIYDMEAQAGCMYASAASPDMTYPGDFFPGQYGAEGEEEEWTDDEDEEDDDEEDEEDDWDGEEEF